jgi:hypothetical protein
MTSRKEFFETESAARLRHRAEAGFRHLFVGAIALGLAMTSDGIRAEEKEPDHFRGQIASIDSSAISLDTGNGSPVRMALSDQVTVIKLSNASFTELDFGTYVGSVAKKLDKYSPIVRDSLSWLHEGYELRIIDEDLRGIALGHKSWDLTPESIMAHGWVDDLEIRVISIKYGPTEQEETDVEIPRDVPILRMSLADKSVLHEGIRAFVGAEKDASGEYVALFVFVGDGEIKPPL